MDDIFDGEISQSMVNNNVQKIVDVLQLLDSNPLLKELMMDMSGFEIRNIDGKNVLTRMRKPKWSDDFTHEIVSIMRRHSNIVTSQSDITKKEIKTYMHYRMHEFNTLVHYTGRSHFITEKIWEKININWLELDKENFPESAKQRYISENLVNKHRDPRDLGDFTVYARNLILDVNNILTVALYRSADALTLQHHQNTQTVREIQRQPVRKAGRMQQLTNRGSDYDNIS